MAMTARFTVKLHLHGIWLCVCCIEIANGDWEGGSKMIKEDPSTANLPGMLACSKTESYNYFIFNMSVTK